MEEARNTIATTLKHMDEMTGGRYNFYSQEAVDLLLGTALQESGGFQWRDQLSGGPARGIFQMEPDTYNDIWRYMTDVRPEFGDMMRNLFTPAGGELSFGQIRNDDTYAAAMARIKYWGFGRGPIPTDLGGQARYWKQFYNTPAGRGTFGEYIENWNRYGGGN